MRHLIRRQQQHEEKQNEGEGMSKRHELKTLPWAFQDTWDGKKLFEIRKNDRDFIAGDKIILREFYRENDIYSGRKIEAKVTYVTSFGQPHGQVVLGISIMWRGVDDES